MCKQYEQRISDLEETILENKEAISNYGNFSLVYGLLFEFLVNPKNIIFLLMSIFFTKC
jgi:hypothetical protein